MAETLLEIKDLKKYYELKSGFLGRDRRVVKAVDGITLTLKEGEILGVVGETDAVNPLLEEVFSV